MSEKTIIDPNEIAAMTGGAPTAPPVTQQPPAAPPKSATTQREEAEEAASPETEADKIDYDAVVYDVPGPNGKAMKMTPQQMAGMSSRYAALNSKHASMKPVINLAEQIMSATGMDAGTLASNMQALAQGHQPNQAFGPGTSQGDAAPATNQAASAPMGQQKAIPSVSEDDLKKWEDDNAVALPPGMREMILSGAGNQQRMAQLEQMLGQVIRQSQGVANAARATHQQSQQQEQGQTRAQIGRNLQQVQNTFNLPDNALNDFVTFVTERGYHLSEFIDSDLAMRVGQDFVNAQNSPELEKLKAAAQRRRSFTPSMGASPTGGGAGGQQAAGGTDPELESLINHYS